MRATGKHVVFITTLIGKRRQQCDEQVMDVYQNGFRYYADVPDIGLIEVDPTGYQFPNGQLQFRGTRIVNIRR